MIPIVSKSPSLHGAGEGTRTPSILVDDALSLVRYECFINAFMTCVLPMGDKKGQSISRLPLKTVMLEPTSYEGKSSSTGTL